MNRTILYILIFVFAGSFLHAQIPFDDENSGFVKNLTEQIHIYTDRDLYLTGEEIWFSAYVVINSTFKEFDISKIVYLELFDVNKKKLFKGKYEIKECVASGNFQIPVETLTGNYFLRAYTNYQRNFQSESFATIMITIINPEYSLPGQEQTEDTLKSNIEKSVSSFKNIESKIEIVVQTEKSVYKKREPLKIKLLMPDTHTDEITGLCVSVVRQGTLRHPDEFVASTIDTEKDLKNVFRFPEIRGISISGTVSETKSLKHLAGINVYLSVLGDNSQLHITQTKENGEFIFSLGYLTQTHEIFIGVQPHDDNDIEILVNNDFSSDFINLQKIPVSIDTNYKLLIEEMLVNYQSQKIFTPYNAEYSEVSQSGYEIFGKPEVSVRLADYIPLPNLEKYFFELVHTAMIRKTDGEKFLYVVDPKTEWVFKNQLLLLDNVPVFNLDAVLSIPPAKIENIDVINSTYYLGDNTLRNVVMINTKAGDFAGYVFPEGSIFVEYQSITPGKKFEAPAYENQLEKDSRIPDFRTLLYWNPELSISSGDSSLSFYTSDNTGDYDIIVRGMTKNGKSCFGKGSISIY